MPEQKWIEKDLATAYDWSYNGVTTSITNECVFDDPCTALKCDEQPNQQCDQSSGEAVCKCNEGTEKKNDVCSPIDPCDRANPAENYSCASFENSQCVKNNDAGSCLCDTSFTAYKKGTDGNYAAMTADPAFFANTEDVKCVNPNMCLDSTTACGANTNCLVVTGDNGLPSKVCECETGFADARGDSAVAPLDCRSTETTQAATEAATQAPTQPATQAPTQPPTQPATQAPTQPATQAPTRPATQAPTQPATQAPTRPATQAPTQPATQAPTQPATQAPTQPATQAPTQPATQAPTQPATQAPTQPATQAPTQPATQAPTQPATQAPTQPPTQAPTQPATQAPTQPATTQAATEPATTMAAVLKDFSLKLTKNIQKTWDPKMADKNSNEYADTKKEIEDELNNSDSLSEAKLGFKVNAEVTDLRDASAARRRRRSTGGIEADITYTGQAQISSESALQANIVSAVEQAATSSTLINSGVVVAESLTSSEPATELAPTQPATQAPTQPATNAPTQAATQPATPASTKPATEAPTKAATQAPTKPATQAPTKPVTQTPTGGPTKPVATTRPVQKETTKQQATVAPGEKDCDSVAGLCVMHVDTAMNFSDAKEYCETLHMHLPSPTTDAYNSKLAGIESWLDILVNALIKSPKEYKKWELPFVRRQRAYLHPDGKWDIVQAEEEREFTCVESRVKCPHFFGDDHENFVNGAFYKMHAFNRRFSKIDADDVDDEEEFSVGTTFAFRCPRNASPNKWDKSRDFSFKCVRNNKGGANFVKCDSKRCTKFNRNNVIDADHTVFNC